MLGHWDTNVRILDPEIYIPPGAGNLKAKGGPFASTHVSGKSLDRARGRSCENVPAGNSDRTSKSQRKGRPESHLTKRGVGVRWGSETKDQDPLCWHFPLFQADFNAVHDPVLVATWWLHEHKREKPRF
jgi:hypothetical protein